MAPFSVLAGNGLISRASGAGRKQIQGIGFRASTHQLPEWIHVEKWNEESHRNASGLLSMTAAASKRSRIRLDVQLSFERSRTSASIFCFAPRAPAHWPRSGGCSSTAGTQSPHGSGKGARRGCGEVVRQLCVLVTSAVNSCQTGSITTLRIFVGVTSRRLGIPLDLPEPLRLAALIYRD